MNNISKSLKINSKLFLVAISLISGSIIAYEILLMRLLSIIQWHHFAYMIISLALLGFGASGTLITLLREKLVQRFKQTFLVCSLTFSFSTVVCFLISERVPLNPFMIVWDERQYLYLLIYYLILFVPFFFGATCIALSFTKFKEKIDRIYFFDLLGSGIGAFVIVSAMYFLAPTRNIIFIASLGFLAAFIASIPSFRWTIAVFILSIGFIRYFWINPIELKISQYKELSSTLNFPEAEVLSKDFTPLGLLHVVKSPAIHSAAGLSLNYQGEIPPQLGLFSDAGSMNPITKFDDISQLRYLDYTTSALPYHILEHPKVLILGTGGGTGIRRAIYQKTPEIYAVELNPQVIDFVENKYGDFSNHIYTWENPQTKVKSKISEARGYVQATDETFDLIELSLLDSFTAASAGVHALSENYLYTVKGISQYLERLNPGGILAITRWLKFPPRDSLKMVATIVEAIESKDEEASSRLAFIRSWQTSTILVKRTPLTNTEVDSIRDFCEERSFDLVYYPGIDKSELNRYNLLDEPEFFQGVKSILSPDRKEFYEKYIFNIEPATDNRPYFFHFFKWKSLPYLIEKIGRDYIPFLEWGYIILIATLIQATFVSFILIVLPMFFMKRRQKVREEKEQENNPKSEVDLPSHSIFKIVVYFLCLGIGFMFVEMTFIQKFMLLLSYPTYAISVVLCSFLFFAGLGSFSCKRMQFRNYSPISIPVSGILILGLIYLLFLDRFFNFFLASSEPIRILISVVLIAPLGFFMGMPFPLGLSRVSSKFPQLVPWAYAINGCASVISTILGTTLAISFGFFWVTLIALGLYGISWLAWLRFS